MKGAGKLKLGDPVEVVLRSYLSTSYPGHWKPAAYYRKVTDLRGLHWAYPGGMSNEDLATAAGYAAGGGAYNNPRGRLRTLGLIEYQGGIVRARGILFL